MERKKISELAKMMVGNFLITKFRKQYLYYSMIKLLLENAKKVERNSRAIKTTIKRTTKKHPAQSLLITFGAGFIIGELLRRFRSL